MFHQDHGAERTSWVGRVCPRTDFEGVVRRGVAGPVAPGVRSLLCLDRDFRSGKYKGLWGVPRQARTQLSWRGPQGTAVPSFCYRNVPQRCPAPSVPYSHLTPWPALPRASHLLLARGQGPSHGALGQAGRRSAGSSLRQPLPDPPRSGPLGCLVTVFPAALEGEL